eukprot:1071707-Pyramimonas_sp.AAC.1
MADAPSRRYPLVSKHIPPLTNRLPRSVQVYNDRIRDLLAEDPEDERSKDAKGVGGTFAKAKGAGAERHV